ncbi:MAG: hypothetical protein AAF639_35875 [Chloroflexota bacterium]
MQASELTMVMHRLCEESQQNHPFTIHSWTPAPLQLEKVVRLDWPMVCVFDLVANHKIWPKIFPWLQDVVVDNTHAIVKNGLGARRRCNFGNGMILEEVIIGWHPPQMYAYASLDDNHPFGMTSHVGVLSCGNALLDDVEQNASGDVGSTQTTLTWRHYFHHLNPAAMQTQLNQSLDAAIQGLIGCCGGKVQSTTYNTNKLRTNKEQVIKWL